MKTTYIFGVCTTHFMSLFKKVVFLLYLFWGVSSYSQGQNVVSLADFKTQLQKEKSQELKSLEKLLEASNSVAYVDKKGVKIYLEGEQPVQKIFTTPSYLHNLSTSDKALLSSVMIKISLQNENDLKGSIDLAKLKQLPNLKYVYILSEVECDIAGVMKKVLKGTNEKLTVFYKVSIPK